ncbi:MAG: oxamate carbamoyltransferase subunit AllH family protein [Actinomycetota bacterium]
MKATLSGPGAREALSAGGEGTVLAWFPRACYVSLPGGLLVLVGPTVPPGPIHLALDRPLPPTKTGSTVRVSGGRVAVGDRTIDVLTAVAWSGPLPSPRAVLATTGAAARAALDVAAGSALASDQFRDRALRARRALRAGNLEKSADILAGLGPGLTPSGDDALAGILFAIRAAAGETIEPRAALVAGSARSGPIPRAFLAWAARGQALQPAHDLLLAVTAEDGEGAARAAWALGAVGETSGADFLLGLAWGLEAAQRVAGRDVEPSTSR